MAGRQGIFLRTDLCEYAFMRTTVDLPDPLFKRVKAEAALRGLRLREFIAQSLERSLEEGHTGKKVRRVQLPLIRSTGKHRINPTREELDAATWD